MSSRLSGKMKYILTTCTWNDNVCFYCFKKVLPLHLFIIKILFQTHTKEDIHKFNEAVSNP